MLFVSPGYTPLGAAVRCAFGDVLDLVKDMLERGADPNSPKEEYAPTYSALSNKKSKVFRVSEFQYVLIHPGFVNDYMYGYHHVPNKFKCHSN